MKDLKIIVLLTFLIFLLSACATEKQTYEQKEYGSGSIMAVWDLEDLSISRMTSLKDMQEFLTGTVVETLKNQGKYELIERQKLLLALEELNLGSSELASDSSRLRVGQIIGAQLMVFGGYQLFGEQLRIDLRMVEVESGAVLKAVEHTAKAADVSGWITAAEETALKLCN